MLHQFTCTAYEIDELNYANLVSFGIINPTVSSNYESQWGSVDINTTLAANAETTEWVKISPDGVSMDAIEIQDFAPGDQIRIVYDSGPDGIFSIGVTGNLELNNDDRTIIDVYIKPNRDMEQYNDFSRSFLYRTTNLQLTKFDAITNFKTYSRVCEQFIGPADDLLEPYILRDKVYGERNEDGLVLNPLTDLQAFNNVYNDLRAHHRLTYRITEDAEKWTGLKVDILHVTKKNIIPIYLYTNKINNLYENKFGITPFGIPYVNSTNISQFINDRRTAIKYVDNVITLDDNGEYIRADGVRVEDIVTILDAEGLTYNSYDLLEPYFLYEPTQEWVSFKDYPTTPPINVGYYDLYRRNWWSPNVEYDPTFSINVLDEFPEKDEQDNIIIEHDIIGDNNISLLEINDITLENLGSITNLHLGSGVVAEVTAQIHVVDYEIEEMDSATKFWKEEYLTTKNSLEPLIDVAMLHIDELNSAEVEYDKILTEIKEIEEQINLSEQGTSATEGVMSIAATRLINQKKKLWYTLEQQIEDVLDLLKTQKVYSNINATLSDQVAALTDYIYDDEEAIEQNFFDTENPKELGVTNLLYLYENPSEQGYMVINDVEQIFRIISDAFLFYAPEYENKQQNAQNIITKCENQLMALAAQRGAIVGGYLEDYDEDHLPPSNTLVSVQYQLAKIDQEIAEAEQHIVEIKSKYITKLLSAILRENEVTLDNLTDEYIRENADELMTLISSYLTIRKEDLQNLMTKYYTTLGQYIYQNDNFTFNTNEAPSRSIVAGIEGTLASVTKNNNNYSDPTEGQIYNALVSADDNDYNNISSLADIYNYMEQSSATNKFKQLLIDYYPILGAYCSAYDLYSVELQNQITVLESQYNTLASIHTNPGSVNREYASLQRDYNTDAVNAFDQAVTNIRTSYIDNTTNIINRQLSYAAINKTLDDLLYLNSNSTSNDRVNAILNILVDEYNKSQANTVQQYLKEYSAESRSSTTTVREIIDAIENANATYSTQLQQLTTKRSNYETEEQKYKNQINEIQKTTDAVEQTKANAIEEYNSATEMLSFGNATQAFQDSEDLINQIINNNIHQNNVAFSIDYMTWLEQSQSKLLDQVGQIFSNLELARDYAALMLEYINAYELEAFSLLHQYNALEVDLQQGFYGEDGIDWLYYQPDKYWLSSYKNILLLHEETTYNEQTGEYDLPEGLLENLTSLDEQTRLDTYAELREHLKDKLLDKDDNFKLGILVSNGEYGYKYRLVKIGETSSDIFYDNPTFYPDVYELTDINYETPIMLSDNDFLLPDTATYTVAGDGSCELRVVEPIDIGEVTPVYRKNPRAAGYYTYNSTRSNLINAFDKDISLVTDEEFAQKAQLASSMGKPLQWLTNIIPVQISIGFHNSLFNEYTYASTAATLDTNPNIFVINPIYYHHFDKMLGSIVHNYKNGNEYGSWMGLKELDKQIFAELNAYFTAYATYKNLSVSNNANIEEYNRLRGIIEELENQLNRYRGIALECRTVLSSYDAQQVDPDSSEYQQLLILLETAEEEINYYTEQKALYDAQLETILNENIEFRDYTAYMDTLPDSKRHLEQLIEEYNNEYQLYDAKVKHYIYLMLNNEPYGHYIDTSIVARQEILNINNSKTNMYNFGIAYALEVYKKNKDSDEPINFTALIDGIDALNEILNNNFDFVFPIPKYTQLATNARFNGANQYYYLDENNEYHEYEYAGVDQWNIDIAARILYLRRSPEIYDNEKSYYIKNDNKFTAYRFIDNTQWEEDRDTLDIYYTYYPSLIDFALKEEYRQINDLDSYNPNAHYYYQIGNNEYQEVFISKDTWQSIIAGSTIYIKVGNGGLKGFLYNLLPDSNYIASIKNNYLGTLNLYISLLAQSLGDTTSLDNLKTLLSKDLIRKKELEDILKYKDASYLDIDAIVNDIYVDLAYYLISLTNAYINLVERSYEVV